MTGRPKATEPKYTADLCDLVIAMGKRGATVVELAIACRVCKQRFTQWRRRHPEFARAFAMSRQYAQVYWETMGRNYLIKDAPLNFQVWRHAMNHAARPEYPKPKTITRHKHRAGSTPLAVFVERTTIRRSQQAAK